MALRSSLQPQPHQYIGDFAGRPLDNGMVYFGEPNKDPEFYPINIYSDSDLSIPLSQPVRTKGGFMYDSGKMTEVYASQYAYSVKIVNNYGAMVFYEPRMEIISIKDSIEINTKLDAAGSVTRTQGDKNSERVSFEDFGAVGDGVTLETTKLQAAINSGAKKIYGRDGAVYLVNNLNIARGIELIGNFELKKPTINDRISTIATGDYTVKFDGVRFNGVYSGAGIEGKDDIVINAVNDGLVLIFNNCQHDNISKQGFTTGYLAAGKAKIIESKGCTSNGNNIIRQMGEEYSVYSAHNTTINIMDYSEVGVGIFEKNAEYVVTKMPCLALFATNSLVKITRPTMRSAGGFLCYKGCDNASMIEPDIDNCGYPWRVQQAASTSLSGGRIINTPFRDGAVQWSPYARIGTALERIKEGLSGLTILDTQFSGNIVDVNAQGVHSQSGLRGVVDCRARHIKIRARFSGAVEGNFIFQDADWDASGSEFTLSPTQTYVASHVQTKAGGAMGARLDNIRLDGTARAVLSLDTPLITHNLNANTVQTDTSLSVIKSNFHNVFCTTAPFIYLRQCIKTDVSDNNFTGIKPAYLSLIAVVKHAKLWGNMGYTYPLGSNNGLVNIGASNPELIQELVTDARKTGVGISKIYSDTAPSYTHFAKGSVAYMSDSDVDGYTARVMTSSGWKRGGKVEVVEV